MTEELNYINKNLNDEKIDKLNEKDIYSFFKLFGFEKPTECQAVLCNKFRKENNSYVLKNIVAKFGDSEEKVEAYIVPAIFFIDKFVKSPQCIIVADNSKNATNIFNIIKRYTKVLGIETLLINNCISFSDQKIRFRRDVQVIVITIKCLNEHLAEKTFKLDHVKILIIDKIEKSIKNEVEKSFLINFIQEKRESCYKWVFCDYEPKEEIISFNKEYILDYMTASINSAPKFSLSNLRYFYFPTSVSGKLQALISILESISSELTKAIIIKNNQSGKDLNNFLYLIGYSSIFIERKEDLNNKNILENKIFIVTNENIELLEKDNINYVISIFGSSDVEECEKRASICNGNGEEGPILLEIVSKFDQYLIKTLKQYNSINVQRFVLQKEEKSLRINRINNIFNLFLKKDRSELNTQVLNLINSYNFEDLKNIFYEFVLHAFNLTIPSFDFNDNMLLNKVEETLNVTFKNGYNDKISEEGIIQWISEIPGSSKENIISSLVLEDKTILSLKNLVKSDIERRILNYPIGEVYLEISNIELITKNTGQDDFGFRERSDSRSSSGGFQRREGGFQRREGNGERRSYGGGERRSYGDRNSSSSRSSTAGSLNTGERKSYGSDERRSYGSGERRSYGGGERRSYGGGERRSYGSGERRSYGDRDSSSSRPSYGNSSYGSSSSSSYVKKESSPEGSFGSENKSTEFKPFERRKSFDRDDRGGSRDGFGRDNRSGGGGRRYGSDDKRGGYSGSKSSFGGGRKPFKRDNDDGFSMKNNSSEYNSMEL